MFDCRTYYRQIIGLSILFHIAFTIIFISVFIINPVGLSKTEVQEMYRTNIIDSVVYFDFMNYKSEAKLLDSSYHMVNLSEGINLCNGCYKPFFIRHNIPENDNISLVCFNFHDYPDLMGFNIVGWDTSSDIYHKKSTYEGYEFCQELKDEYVFWIQSLPGIKENGTIKIKFFEGGNYE